METWNWQQFLFHTQCLEPTTASKVFFVSFLGEFFDVWVREWCLWAAKVGSLIRNEHICNFATKRIPNMMQSRPCIVFGFWPFRLIYFSRQVNLFSSPASLLIKLPTDFSQRMRLKEESVCTQQNDPITSRAWNYPEGCSGEHRENC